MRQVTFPRFFIFSANSHGLKTNENHVRTREAYNTLLDLGLNFTCVTGVYKGVTEASFFVYDSEGARENIATLCKLYGQECYLERDLDNEGYLIDGEGIKTSIGTPKEVTRQEASGLESFTILPQNDNVKKYFTFVKEQ